MFFEDGVTVLTKPNCPQCIRVKRELKSNGVPFTEQQFTDDSLMWAKSVGHRSAPVVVVVNDGVIEMNECGYHPGIIHFATEHFGADNE